MVILLVTLVSLLALSGPAAAQGGRGAPTRRQPSPTAPLPTTFEGRRTKFYCNFKQLRKPFYGNQFNVHMYIYACKMYLICSMFANLHIYLFLSYIHTLHIYRPAENFIFEYFFLSVLNETCRRLNIGCQFDSKSPRFSMRPMDHGFLLMCVPIRHHKGLFTMTTMIYLRVINHQY